MVNIPLSKSGLKLFSNDVEETINEELPITEESLEELKKFTRILFSDYSDSLKSRKELL